MFLSCFNFSSPKIDAGVVGLVKRWGGGEYRRLKFGKKFEKGSRIKLKGIKKSSTGGKSMEGLLG